MTFPFPLLKLQMMAVRGTGQSGYLAIDDVELFVDFSVETCQISPNEATPTTPGNLSWGIDTIQRNIQL